MSNKSERTLAIERLIYDLPLDQQEAAEELIEHIRRVVKRAGEPVGTLAVTLVVSEAQDDLGL